MVQLLLLSPEPEREIPNIVNFTRVKYNYLINILLNNPLRNQNHGHVTPQNNFTHCSVPNVFLSNVRAISSKLDDLDLLLKMNAVDFSSDSCVNISGYSHVRNDQTEKRGGIVCAFTKSSIPFRTLPNLNCPKHECLLVKL